MTARHLFFILPISLLLFCNSTFAQTLTLKDAESKALSNYGTIKAKQNYASASKQLVMQSKLQYLPNINASIQQDFGTVNGQDGPMYGFGGYAVASSGPPLADQNWNAAFGALYLANINWDFFTFGRVWGQVKIAQAAANRDEQDLSQEEFEHAIKVAAAYLNLLAAQRLVISQQSNLDRALTFRNTTVARAANGLNAGVDSSLANAEVSNARLLLIRAKDNEQELANQLGILLGETATDYALDTSFVSSIPANILNPSEANIENHPLLQYYQSRIDFSNAQLKYYKRMYYPTLSMFGVIQGRASGFYSDYAGDRQDYTVSYATGVTPTRGNYLFGLGLNWNFSSIPRTIPQVKAQKLIAQANKEEYQLADDEIKAQAALSETKIKNALDAYAEAPVQVKAATDAFTQKTALYKNGLATIVDVTQALYALNRAETDRDIVYTNVWQALLLKAAAAGQLSIFLNEF